MNVDADVSVAPMKAALFVSDFSNASARDVLEHLVRDRVGTPGFAREHNPVCRHQSFDGDPRFRIVGQVSIDDGVRYPITDLVWMSFRHGLTGEQIG